MTGHREPPAEWIPLIAAIVRITDVQEAFERALIGQIELEMGRKILSDSIGNKMVGPDSAVTFLLSGFRVIATARGRLTTVVDNKADHALGEMAARAVKTACRVAGLAVARLMTDGFYKAHGRHGTLRSPHEPIPGDLVYAQAVSFDICSGIASYSDGAQAASVHLERTDKPFAAEAVPGQETVLGGKRVAVPVETNSSQEHAQGPRSKKIEFERWLSDRIDETGSKKALNRDEAVAMAFELFGIKSRRRALSSRKAVLSKKPLEIQALYTARGAPRKSDQRKRFKRNDSDN